MNLAKSWREGFHFQFLWYSDGFRVCHPEHVNISPRPIKRLRMWSADMDGHNKAGYYSSAALECLELTAPVTIQGLHNDGTCSVTSNGATEKCILKWLVLKGNTFPTKGFFLAICPSVTCITRFKWVFVIIYNPVLSSGPAEEPLSVLDAKKTTTVHLSRKKVLKKLTEFIGFNL